MWKVGTLHSVQIHAWLSALHVVQINFTIPDSDFLIRRISSRTFHISKLRGQYACHRRIIQSWQLQLLKPLMAEFVINNLLTRYPRSAITMESQVLVLTPLLAADMQILSFPQTYWPNYLGWGWLLHPLKLSTDLITNSTCHTQCSITQWNDDALLYLAFLL